MTSRVSSKLVAALLLMVLGVSSPGGAAQTQSGEVAGGQSGRGASVMPSHFEPSMMEYFEINRSARTLLTSDGSFRVAPTARIVVNGKFVGVGLDALGEIERGADLFVRFDETGKILEEVWVVSGGK